ncbi:MAG: serine/threonine protein kinase [Planctomycetota bacterium]|nr:serine/threonine protein kinase [Planctomycetota bacterium]
MGLEDLPAHEQPPALEPPSFVLVEVLKADDLGRIELGRLGVRTHAGQAGGLGDPEHGGPGGQLVIRRLAARGPLGFFARALLRREARALDLLDGVAGVVPLLGRTGSRELLRGYAPGVPLHRTERLPEDFFEQLAELVRDLHARGVAHNDLHKEPNVLVGEDGRPVLVDFQLASVHRRGSRRLARRAAEDLRHVAKHAARYLDRDSGRRSSRAERGLVSRVWMATGKKLYNVVTRRLLHRPDAEGRRPRGGPWPKWQPPVGPR